MRHSYIPGMILTIFHEREQTNFIYCAKKAQMQKHAPKPYVQLKNPEWTRDAVIYELNIRQFTSGGTFTEATKRLPDIKNLGADILWLMPIHPIGVKNRKGRLGSPYAVKDYYSIHPDLGSADDLKHFIREAHRLGMKVIIDWVANHTAWDHVLVNKHPEWYARDWKGDFRPSQWWDWSDIIELDYNHAGLRKYMTDAMKYWIQEFDLDGFRADIAGFVPLDFWELARKELEQIKPVFMLAEWESRDLHAAAFDASYAWSWWDAVHAIASGQTKDLLPLYVYYSFRERAYPAESMRMTFVTNHDKNALEGTSRELLGDALEAAITLAFIGDGIPLIYNGQEAGDSHRLAFFEKDEIRWTSHPHGALLKKLIACKKENPALWNGRWGGPMIQVNHSREDKVLSFLRTKGDNRVFAAFNFSPDAQEVLFHTRLHHGRYQELETGNIVHFSEDTHILMPPWQAKVYISVR